MTLIARKKFGLKIELITEFIKLFKFAFLLKVSIPSAPFSSSNKSVLFLFEA